MTSPNGKTELTPEMLKAVRAYNEFSFITFYERSFQFKFPNHLFVPVQALCDIRIKKLLILVGPGSGKAVQYGTNVLTPTGWVKVENLIVGQTIYTPMGTPTKVLAKWLQPKMPMYEITFKDGRKAVVNENHLWKCYWKKFRRVTPENPWRIRTTKELFDYSWNNCYGRQSAPRFYIPLTSPIPFPKKELLLDPYVLGCLLGDGALSQNYTSITTMDEELIEFFKQKQIKIGAIQQKKDNKASSYGLPGMNKMMEALGLAECKSNTKFIPEMYKWGSIEQRFSLFQGLMDTDGTISKGGTISFCTVSMQLAEDMKNLIYSLGGIVKISKKSAWFKNFKGEKLNGQIAYQLNIRFPFPEQAFKISRKKNKARKTQYSDDLKLEIISIVPMKKAESICISVSDPSGLFLIDDYVVTHNSQLLSVCYPAWALGHDPTLTILGVSASEGLIQGFVQASMELIEGRGTGAWYPIVFPNVKPDKDSGWSPLRGAYVTGRPVGIPDPSYVGAGLTSKALTGKHAKILIFDDLHDFENSLNPEQCKKVIDKYYGQLIGRADPAGARFIVAGRRWNESDLYGHILKNEADQWVVLTLPAERRNSSRLYWNIQVPDGLECVFTEQTNDQTRS